MYPDVKRSRRSIRQAVRHRRLRDFLMRLAMAQGIIAESAFRKAEEAGASGLAKFVVRLSDGLLTPSEIEALEELGMTEYLPFFKRAMVVIPGRRLLDLAELESVVQVS